MGKHELPIQPGDRVEIAGQRFGRVLDIDADRRATIRLDSGKVIDLQRFNYWFAPNAAELVEICERVRSDRNYPNHHALDGLDAYQQDDYFDDHAEVIR